MGEQIVPTRRASERRKYKKGLGLAVRSHSRLQFSGQGAVSRDLVMLEMSMA